MEAQNTEKRDSEKQKKSKAGRAVAIAVIILLLLALIVCLIIIFTHRHTMTHYAYAEATCTAGGNAEYWYCAGCDGYFEDEEGENEVEFSGLILPAAGHEWMAASCDSPRRCNICGYSDGAALGHSWGDYEFSPSDCGSEGAILRVCTACGEVERIAVPVHGNAHNWGSIAVVQPSCVSAGRAVLTCADCGETVSSVIPATGAHHWDDGKITMPGCTGTGSIIHTCIDCGATETDVIPASGHVWISAGCTSPVTCAVCGATSGSALGHNWDDWTPAGDANHSRVCSRCHSVEYEEHDFGGAEYGTCTVCGYTKEQPATDEGTLIEALVEFWNSRASGVTYFDSNGDLDITLSGLFGYSYYLMCGANNNIVFSLYNYDYNEVLSSDMQLSVSILDGYQDLYVTLQNDSNPDIKIEYHPIRYTLYVYNESANGGAGDFEVLSDENKTYQDLTIKELNSALADGVLNRTFAEGSGMDFTFRIEWEWAFMLDDGEVFEIKDAEGNTYSFNQDNIDKLDTDLENVINVGYPEHGTISDTDNNTWTVLNRSDAGGNLLYNDEFAFDINVSLNSI